MCYTYDIIGNMKRKSIVSTKKSASFRLSQTCIKMIKQLSECNGISQSAVIELAIRAEVKKRAKH